MTRAVLFGSADALLDLDEARIEAWSVALAEAGIAWDWTPARRSAFLGGGDPKETIEAAGRDEELWIDPEAIALRMARLLSDRLATRPAPLRPGAAAALAAANSRQVAVALVSDLDRTAVAHGPLASARVAATHAAALRALGLPANAVRALEVDAAGAERARAAGLDPVRLSAGAVLTSAALGVD